MELSYVHYAWVVACRPSPTYMGTVVCPVLPALRLLVPQRQNAIIEWHANLIKFFKVCSYGKYSIVIHHSYVCTYVPA